MKHVPKVTLKEMLTNPMLRQPLVIAMFMMMAQQLSGINCVSKFQNQLFLNISLSITKPNTQGWISKSSES